MPARSCSRLRIAGAAISSSISGHRLGAAGGLVVDDVGGVVGVAEQRRPLGAQRGDPGDQRRGCRARRRACRGWSRPRAAGGARRGRAASEIAGWIVGRQQGEQVALEAALLGGERGRLDGVVGEPGELGPVGDVHGAGRWPRPAGSCRTRVVSRGDLLVELAQALLLLGAASAAPGADEVGVVPLDEPDAAPR